MTFTSRDIQHDTGLRNFIRTRITSDRVKLVDGYLLNIYDTEEIIDVLKAKIKKHSKGTNCTRYIPKWKDHIKSLKAMSSTEHP